MWINDNDWATFKKEFDSLKQLVNKINGAIKNIKGSPDIQGSAGVKIELNGRFSVTELNKRLADDEARINKLEHP